MAVKFRHKETGLFWCRAKGRSPSIREYNELGEEALDYMKYGQSDVYFKLLDAEMGDYNHSYREDCGVFTLQDVIDKLPKFITPMPSKQIRFSCFINIFGGIKYVNEDDVNDVLKLIRGNNLLETDEWKGDVNE